MKKHYVVNSTFDINKIKNIISRMFITSKESPELLSQKWFLDNLNNQSSKFFYLLHSSEVQSYFFTDFNGSVVQGYSFKSKNKKFDEDQFLQLCIFIIKDFQKGIPLFFRFIIDSKPSSHLQLYFSKIGFVLSERFLMKLHLEKYTEKKLEKYDKQIFDHYSLKSEIMEELPKIIHLIYIAEKNTIDELLYPEMQSEEEIETLVGLTQENAVQYSNKATKLLYNKEELIGVNLISIFTNQSSYVAQLAIHPDYRRKKLAILLMNESIQSLKEMGSQEVRLHVTKSNDPARLLYETLGFEKVKSTYAITQKIENKG